MDVLLADAGLNMASVCRVGGCAECTLESFMVFLKGHVLSSALHAARFVALPCCDLCDLTLGESCPCFQFVVLLFDAAMLELLVRVGAFLDVHELLIFWLAGRIQSKEGSKTLVFKGERHVKVFSKSFCFESVFLRASVAFGVLQQLCSCIVKSLSAATQFAGAAVAIAIHNTLVCAFSKSFVPKGLDFCSCAGHWLLEGRLRESSSCIHQSACGQVRWFWSLFLLAPWDPGGFGLSLVGILV